MSGKIFKYTTRNGEREFIRTSAVKEKYNKKSYGYLSSTTLRSANEDKDYGAEVSLSLHYRKKDANDNNYLAEIKLGPKREFVLLDDLPDMLDFYANYGSIFTAFIELEKIEEDVAPL